jgi:copper(I)-binding protein
MLFPYPLRHLSLALLACAGLAVANPAPPTLRADNAWIRWLPEGLPAAAYLTLTDSGDAPAVLIGASSPSYGSISFHRSMEAGGSMSMQPVEKITIHPHSSLDFGLAHYHMMLMEPKAAVRPGARVPITLAFLDGSALEVDFEVRSGDAAS